jgi:hypothetical protein
MMTGVLQAIQDALWQSTPFPSRLGRPVECAVKVKHIVENTMLNGETIPRDGGLRLPPRWLRQSLPIFCLWLCLIELPDSVTNSRRCWRISRYSNVPLLIREFD